jgi:hypothetical protein
MVGLLGRVISRYLHTKQHKHKINAHANIHALVGFEPTIPAFERAKAVHASDCAATEQLYRPLITGNVDIVYKMTAGGFSPITSVSFANSHSTYCPTSIN